MSRALSSAVEQIEQSALVLERCALRRRGNGAKGAENHFQSFTADFQLHSYCP